LQLPPAPLQVTELLHSLKERNADLKQDLAAFKTSKRVPLQKFENILAKYSLKANAIVANFFKGTHGDLNVQQILGYYE
jgi:hypothetical protein